MKHAEMPRDARRFDQGSAVRTLSVRIAEPAECLGHLDKGLAGSVSLVFLEFEPTDLSLESLRRQHKLLAGIARPGMACGSGITVVT